MILFVTSNQSKLKNAQQQLQPFGIELENNPLDLEEIQSDSIEEIAKHKATQAFNILKTPLIVTDHGWSYRALQGFPGAYMKHMNKWLTADDFINLMKPYQDKEVTLHEVLCFTDGQQLKTFSHDFPGKFLDQASGEGVPGETTVSLHPNGKSIAMCRQEGISSIEINPAWQEFANWYHLLLNS